MECSLAERVGLAPNPVCYGFVGQESMAVCDVVQTLQNLGVRAESLDPKRNHDCFAALV